MMVHTRATLSSAPTNGEIIDIGEMCIKDYLKDRGAFQYLGFLISPRHISIRPPTIARLYRKHAKLQIAKNKANPHKKVKDATNELKDKDEPRSNKKYNYMKKAQRVIDDDRLAKQLRKVRRRIARKSAKGQPSA